MQEAFMATDIPNALIPKHYQRHAEN